VKDVTRAMWIDRAEKIVKKVEAAPVVIEFLEYASMIAQRFT